MAGINTKGAKKDCFQMWEGISMIKDNEERISGNRREHSWTAFWQREFLFQPDSKGHEKKRPEDWAEGIQTDSRPGDIPYSIGCQYFVHVPFRVILANAQVIGDAEQKPGSYGEQNEGSKGIFVNVFYFSQFDGRQEKAQTEQGDGGWSKGNLVGRHGVLEPVRAEADQDQDKNRIFQFQQDGGNEGTENDIPQKPCGRGKGFSRQSIDGKRNKIGSEKGAEACKVA